MGIYLFVKKNAQLNQQEVCTKSPLEHV